MEIMEILKDSLRYPLINDNRNNFIMMYVIMLVILLFGSIIVLTIPDTNTLAIAGIIYFILLIVALIFLFGYNLSIIKDSLTGSEDLPEINFSKDIIYGLKTLVLGFIYAIPLIIITILLALFAGLTIYSAYYYSEASGYALLTVILTIIALIYSIILVFFMPVAEARLAETDSISEALNIKFIHSKISQIGRIKILGVVFLIGIVSGLLSTIGEYLGMIDTVGWLFSAIITAFVYVYIEMATARSTALLYRESYSNQFGGQNPNNPNYQQRQMDNPQNQYQQYPNNQQSPMDNNQYVNKIDFNPEDEDN